MEPQSTRPSLAWMARPDMTATDVSTPHDSDVVVMRAIAWTKEMLQSQADGLTWVQTKEQGQGKTQTW